MLQGKNRFDQARDAGTAFRVPNIWLHRANIHAPFTEDVAYCSGLDGIACCSTSAVALRCVTQPSFFLEA